MDNGQAGSRRPLPFGVVSVAVVIVLSNFLIRFERTLMEVLTPCYIRFIEKDIHTHRTIILQKVVFHRHPVIGAIL